jgi:hypothetical protein
MDGWKKMYHQPNSYAGQDDMLARSHRLKVGLEVHVILVLAFDGEPTAGPQWDHFLGAQWRCSGSIPQQGGGTG